MTSEQLKDELVRKIIQSCTSWATDIQRQTVEASLILALNDLTLSREEVSLSTEFSITNEEYLRQFLAIKMVKGLSARTIKRYDSEVKQFLLNVEKPVPVITSNDIRYYLAVKKQRDGVCNTTLNGTLLCLRSFFSTLMAEEIIQRDPTAKIDRIKVEKKVRSPFSEMEVEKLRRECANPRNRSTNILRNLAILEVLYSTGCRIGELVGIQRKDIDGERVTVLGKGNKERIVYLNPRAQMAIEQYLSSRTDDFLWLFPGGCFAASEKNTVVDKPIDIGTVEAMIRKLGKRAGIENCHPHRFRRTAATVALRRGMPIEQVSKMLGHEQLTTTQIYAITADEDVQNAHRKYMT